MSSRLLVHQIGHEQLPSLASDARSGSEARTTTSRSGTIALLERRLSRGVPGRLSRRISRPNSGSSTRRGSSSSLKFVPEIVEEEKPSSPTVLRLRALAHAVRARHSLGIQRPAQRKYLLQASEAGTEGETDVGVDLLMAGIQTKLKEDAASTTYSSKSKQPGNNHSETAINQREARPGSAKSKVRFTKDGDSGGDAARNEAAVGKPPLRSAVKSATMKRGSATKLSLQRVNTIRGNLSAFIKPYDAKARDADASLDHTQNLGARLTCAHSLYKLSCQVGSELAIITGGAIAQIAEFSDVEDSKLLRYSATVLVNVTTDMSVLEDFAAKDGVSALLELSWTPLIDVKVACTTALCRLSQSRARAAVLIRSRAITELMSMLTVPHVPLQQLVVSCIVNLVFYGHAFPDRVFLGDPQAVQSPLGLMNVISQLSTSPSTSQFALEALFNLSLHRSSCLGALRGGGAEILHTIVSQLCKLVDGNGGGSSSRYLLSLGVHAPAWTADMGICLKLLRLAADALANFSVFVEYHNMMGSHGLKALMLMLSGALREVGNFTASVATEERFRCTGVSCSRALANFSCNSEIRRQNFPMELIQLATKLALMDHHRYAGTAKDARALMRNSVRTLSNLSFEQSCRVSFTEMPQMLLMLHAITVLPAIAVEEVDDDASPCRTAEEQQARARQEQEQDGRMPSMTEASECSTPIGFGGIVGSIELGLLSTPPPIWYLRSSNATSFPWTTAMSEDAKEDALVALLNIAQHGTFGNDLLRTLDGKLLALAAEDTGHSRRLRYIYSIVLSNLLFDNYLQQLVYGDQVVRALVSGFTFFETNAGVKEDDGAPSLELTDSSNSEKAQFQALNVAFDDDQERFLASIYLIASELMDLSNIELVVALILPCMRTYMKLAGALPSNAPLSHPQRIQLQRQLPITCYASASLFALTRAATQRRDSHKHLTHSEEAESMLIAVCAMSSASGGGGAAGSSVSSSSSSRSGITQAFCAATLYHLCASTSVNQRVIQGLINCCNVNEESQSLLACSAAFAIISFTAEGCQQLVQCANLARALNRLGRTSQVECQQYAAIAACNVSTVSCVWSSAELKDFIVVALLRANSIQAKQIHAKTLSNLLSHGATRPNVVEDGVLYALMKLSQVMMSGTGGAGERRLSIENASTLSLSINSSVASSSADEVFSIGLRALFNLSCDRQYHNKLLSNGVMAYLSAAVECKQPGGTPSDSRSNVLGSSPSPTMTSLRFGSGREHQRLQQQQLLQCLASHLSTESRRFALAIMCNLASYEENHKELIRAQVTEIIRNYVDGDIECRASAAMALRNLSCCQPWVEMLCERKTLQLLIACTECEHPVVRQFAIEALANCSLVTDSLHLFGEMRVPRAVLALLEVTANALPTTVSPVSVSWELSGDQEGQTMMNPITERQPTGTSTYMAALRCLHNIAHDDALAMALMEESIILRLLPLLEYRALGHDANACELAATLTHTLAGKPRCAEALLRQRTVSLCALLHRRHATSTVIARECVRILMLLSTYQHIQLQLCETQAVHVVVSICGGSGASPAMSNPMVTARNLRLRECGAVTIRNLTLSVTEHLALFYDRHDDGDGSLHDVGRSHNEKPIDTLKDLQNDADSEDGVPESPVSLMLERHMLHGIKYFQEEIVSGQASDRILLEASAAIANLSTVKAFRVAMVRLGVIPTLLELMAQPMSKPKAQRMTLSSPALTPAPTSPVRLRPMYRNTLLGRICAATLHRLVVEEGAAFDARNQLVPSLLSVLRQTDEELQQVRYECEKISIFSANSIGDAPVGVTPPSSHGARRFTLVQTHTPVLPRPADLASEASEATPLSSPVGRRVFGSCGAVGAPPAATHCVRQTYREQKWMVYVLKTILSSQAMIPQLEKKQMRVLGTPKLCFQDLLPSATAVPPAPVAPNGSSSSRSTNSGPHNEAETAGEGAPRGGYLLPVSMEKHAIRRVSGSEEIVPVSAVASTSPRPKSANTVTSRPIMSGTNARSSSASPNRSPVERDTSAIDPQGHVRKFNRQMRLLRRNDRRDIGSLPPV